MVQTLYLGGTAFSNVTVGSTTVTAVYVGSTKIWEAGVSWTDPDLANASYDSVSLDVSSQEANPTGLFFKPDGTKMYVIGFGGDEINEYSLSTAWDISSASATSALSVLALENAPRDLCFKDDGTELYFVGTTNDKVNQYSLSTAWDITSATFTRDFSVRTQATFPRGITFKSDGSKMYISGTDTDNIYQYGLSTSWDISTASYDNKSYDPNTANPTGPRFSPDGTKLFTVDNTANDVRSHTLSTAWDISTASYDNVSFNVNNQSTLAQGLFFKSDGSKMYVCGSSADAVFQYST